MTIWIWTAPERIAPELLGLGIAVVPLLVVLSMFTVSLAVVAGVRRQGLPEGERFVVRGAAAFDVEGA